VVGNRYIIIATRAANWTRFDFGFFILFAG